MTLRQQNFGVDRYAATQRPWQFQRWVCGQAVCLDDADATAFLAVFQPMIDVALKRRAN
jgi:hypothetical protein